MDEVTELLVDLETELHGVCIPADVTAAVVTRAAKQLGAELDTAIFQNCVALDLRRGAARTVRVHVIPIEPHWELWRMQRLMDLAHGLGDGRIGLEQARAELDRIRATPPLYAKGVVIATYGVYAFVVAARIGGTALDAVAAVFVGLLAGLISYGAGRFRSVQLQQWLLGGLLGGLLSLLLGSVLPIHAPKVLFAGVALLLPAMALTISIHELANDALESGVLRLVYCLLRFLMLGFGSAAAVTIWQLLAPLPGSQPAEAMPTPWVIALLVPGACALVVYLKAQMRDVGWVLAATVLAYGTQEATKLVVGEDGSPFTAAFVVGVAGQLCGRLFGRMPALFTVPGVLLLTPGFLGTRTVLQRLLDPEGVSPTTLSMVLLVSLQLVTGLFVAAVLFRAWPRSSGARAESGRG